MPELLMNVESIRELSQHLRQAADQIHTTIAKLSQNVNGVIGTSWISQSAMQFQEDFNNSAVAIRTQIDLLESLAIRLEKESAEWEATSKQL